MPLPGSSNTTTPSDLDLLPPALRMAATAGGRRTGPPTIRVPGKTKSFQLRKEQADALAKIRCQPRQDLLTEDEQRKQTLMRRQTNKQRVEMEEQERKLKEQSETIMKIADDKAAQTKHHDSWERTSLVVGGTTTTTTTTTGGTRTSTATTSGATVADLAQHAAALKQQAVAMRAKAQQLQKEQAEITSSSSVAATAKKKEHTPEILEKKLEKVIKLLAAETPGSKEYKKLAKKKEQYETEMEELVMQELQSKASADAVQTALSQAEEAEALAEEAQEAERLAEQQEAAAAAAAAERERQRVAAQERLQQQQQQQQQQQAERERKEQEERERQAQEQREAQEKAAAASALEEEARLLRERAAELKAKREPAAQVVEPEPEPVVDEVMDEKERLRQQRIEEFRRKQAEKKEAEDEAKRKEERSKEFKVLKKKLQKLEGMIKEAEEDGKDTSKLTKKKAEYISQMEEYDEWEQELQIRRKAEELERLQKEREEAEKQRKAALEAERRQKAEEEAERRRKEAEEAQREAERLEKERKEQEERQRQQRLEEARRLEEEARAQRIRDEEEAERRRIEEAERAAREAEEAERRRIEQAEQAARDEELAEQRRIQQEQQAARDAEEAERRRAEQAEKAARDAEEAERRRNEEAQNYSTYSQSIQVQDSEVVVPEPRPIPTPMMAAPEKQPWDSEPDKQSTSEPALVTTSSVPAKAAPASQDFIDRHNIPEPHSANTKKILSELQAVEQHQARLEKTLKQNGIAVSEDIPYEVAKDKIAELQEQMKALATSTEDQFVVQKKYYALEEEMSKYVTAMMLTDEFAEEQRMAEQKWEESIEVDNIAALRKLRSYMPVNIRNMTEDELTSQPTPNGKMLPKDYAKKFKRTNVLQLIRVDPHDLERMHPSLIEGLRSTGLTLTERRALHQHLKDIGETWHELQQDPSIERKYSWFLGLKSKFKEMVTAYDKHVQEYGPPGNHPYAKRNEPQAGGCPLIGNQCPVKADAAMLYDDDYGFTQEAEYEHSGSGGASPAPAKAKRASMLVSKAGGGAKAKDEALMASIREKLNLLEPESAIDSKLIRELFHAEKRSLSLEKQLAQNGIALPKEDISYEVAKAKVAEITEEIKVVASKMGSTMDMKEMATLEKEYSHLSDELEKYNNALMLTKEWALELLEKARQWEERVRPDNQEALRKIRRHMPVNIKDLSEQDMIQGVTPNGKSLPQQIVRKFKRTNILQLLRTPPALIESMHPSSLESMRATGLTLTEQRALHEHLKELGAKWKAASNDKMAERKWMWHESHRSKFKELVDKYQQHVDEYGPPGNHPYAKRGEPGGGCPLVGKQCPLKADLEIDYSDDYGFPEEAVYNVETVKKSNLLTVEELERRKHDDDWENHPAPTREEPEPARPPTAGLMAAIGSRSAGTADSGGPPAKMPTKLIGALAAKSNEESGAPPPRMGGGLLAAIAAKGGGGGGGGDDEAPKRPAMGGLLADIQSKGTESSSDATPQSPKKRMGGLLAAITGRGKKE